MKVKIYIGETVVLRTNQINRFKIEFNGNPANLTRIAFDIKKNGSIVENIDKTFNDSANDISNTLTASTATQTAELLLTNLETYNTNSITTYSLSDELNSNGNKDIYIDVIGDISDVFTFTSIANTTTVLKLTNVGQIQTYDITDLKYDLLDLFDDENIQVTSKFADIEKLTNVFTDFSNSFTIPATSNNNELFKHYYDVDIDNTFNANIRVNAYIEVDSYPFRFGKIQLEAIKLKDKRPDNYKITFYGGLIQLSDLFEDDKINQLDYDVKIVNNQEVFTKTRDMLSRFDYEYTSGNFDATLNDPTFLDGNVITPLISYADRDWNYGTNNSIDIGTTGGAILDTELRPALRVIRIIEAIEAKYNISFSRNFFGKAMFNNLYLWLNGRNEGFNDWQDTTITNAMVPTFSEIDPSAVSADANYVLVTGYKYHQSISGGIYSSGHYFEIVPEVGYTTIPYRIRLVDLNGIVIATSEYVTGTRNFGASFLSSNDEIGNPELITRGVKLQIQSQYSIDFKMNVRGRYANVAVQVLGEKESDNNFNEGDVLQKTYNNLPDIRVLEFLQGIMKMFKLIIRPISENQFYVNTLDGYYADGNILDITKYVDNTTIEVERPRLYKTLTFSYEQTNNVAGKKFRETNDPLNKQIGYGDLKAKYAALNEKEELTVKLPFENMLFERMVVQSPNSLAGTITNIVIGQSISTSDETTFSANNSKPIFFFNNGFVSHTDTPIKIKFFNTIGNYVYSYLIGNTNDELLSQVTDTINWGAEIDPWHNQIVENSLYLNYWSNWINTIYDLKQRKFTFEANLPPRYIEELSLNDRLIINNNRYKINDYKVNLLTGKSTLTLFNDIFDWNEYSFGSNLQYNERSFSPNGWYITDYVNNGGSSYIYGSFTGYNSTSYGRIVKLLPNGDVDNSFSTGSGFNSNLFGFQSIITQSNGKVLATGDFTSFNGNSRNRIVRINTNGSIDSSFNVGTGFNNLTSGIGVDSQDNIIVCGSFSSYNGTNSQRIIKLTSGGTVSTSVANGFNNVTNSIVVNSDDSMYVGGYFSSYSGVSSNRIIKLTSGFTVDTSFNVGTGLNSNTTSQPVGLISAENDGVYVLGFFTTYSGLSANRIVKLLPSGQLNPDFISVSGFNNSISTGYKVLGNKLLLQGAFTNYNGLSVNGAIVLNQDGSIYRSFNGTYQNIFTIGDRFYGNLANGVTELIADETASLLSTNSIIANAGVKYYGINILKNESWTLSKIDLGYGTDWVILLTTEGDGVGECVIRVENKLLQAPPDIYQVRYMDLLFNFNGVYRSVRIKQKGLEE